MLIGGFSEGVEQVLALSGGNGVPLDKLDDSIDKLLFRHLRGLFSTDDIVLVYPHSPLVALVEDDHSLRRRK